MPKTINSNQIITDQEFYDFLEAIGNHQSATELYDSHMAKVYAEDRTDLFCVLEDCMRGNKTSAQNRARSLDTLVREIIPNSIWKTLFNE